MVDTVRGVLRVRSWPKKPGPPKSAKQRFWIDWFTQANRLAKYVDAASAIRAIDLTAKSGLYPRDVLLAAMRGRLYHWADETGWKWYSMAAIGDISESLDVLAQNVGGVLVRALDRWRAPDPGDVGDVLTYQGDAAAPDWQPPAGGGGVFGGALVTSLSDITFDRFIDTPIPFDAEQYDTDALHDALDPTRLTVPTGWSRVRLTGGFEWNVDTTSSQRAMWFWKNGSGFPGKSQFTRLARLRSETCIASPPIEVVPGDFFELVGWHDKTSPKTVKGPADNTYFGMERVS